MFRAASAPGAGAVRVLQILERDASENTHGKLVAITSGGARFRSLESVRIGC
jgi:hypothetical protein